ncbi:unnamed protein product [Mytilus edulis]|uniref:Uncharacterized protein n=1 Tax=Mytilus edulis TaxID=6550 RepID=A0A8S3UK79_MYTED|nr:unnamed protein product [Mytilus edulis]
MKYPKEMRKFNFHLGKVKLLFTIDVVRRNANQWNIPNDCILLSDYTGKIIKYDDKGTKLRELRIPGKPSDITKVDVLNVAVSTDSKQIHLINAETLTLINTITSVETIYVLSFVDNTFITSHRKTAYISWSDSAFKRLRTEKTHRNIFCTLRW